MSASSSNIQAEPEAFAEKARIYEELMGLWDYINRVVRKRIDTYPECEDVVSDVYLSCLSSLDSYRGNCALKTWVYRITLRRIADCFRVRYKRAECGLNRFKADGYHPSHEEDFTKCSEREVLLNRVQECFYVLSDRQKQIFGFLLGGFVVSEIAEIFQVSSRSVYMQYNSGLLRLRSVIYE